MAYSVHCRITDRANEVCQVEFRLPEGERRRGEVAYAELDRINSQIFSSTPPPATELGKSLYNILFGGAEELLEKAIARGQQEPDRSTHILLDAGIYNQRFPWELTALGTPQAPSPSFEIVRWRPRAPRLAKTLPTLPVRILLADMTSADQAQPAFPLRSFLLRLLGQPEHLTQIMQPCEMI
jgi:hypothetical protein